ncbi:putative ribonuclease H-like domain-containing protein [Tanacetum coccineum]
MNLFTISSIDNLLLSQETPGDLTTGDHLSPKVKVFLIPVIEMVNILVSGKGKEYDKVFNHLDMLHAPLEGKETPGDLTTGDRLSPKVKVFLIPRKPTLGFMRPFGYLVTILNTIDHLGKFDGKADEGFFIGYLINSKAFRVFNSRTRIVEENLNVQFSENTPNIAGSGPNWLFDIDVLTKSMNYKPVVAGNQSNDNAGTKACNDAGKDSSMEKFLHDTGFKPSSDGEKKVDGDPSKEDQSNDQEKDGNVNSTNNVNAVSLTVNAVSIKVNVVGAKTSIELPDDLNMSELENIVYSDDDEDVGAEADMNNLDVFMPISPIPTTRIHKDHPVEQIIRDSNSAPQIRIMTKNLEEHGLFSSVQKRTNHKDFQNCLFACFLSQEKPKKVYRNKKDERGIVIENKARLVIQGYTQEEGIEL